MLKFREYTRLKRIFFTFDKIPVNTNQSVCSLWKQLKYCVRIWTKNGKKRWYETHESCQLEYEIRMKKECGLCKRSFISIYIINKAKRIKKLCHPHVIRFLYTYSLFRIWNESVFFLQQFAFAKKRQSKREFWYEGRFKNELENNFFA